MSEIPEKIWSLIRRYKLIVGALLAIFIFLGSLLLYSGIWPPVFVVESESMQHSDTTSYLGIIDTGDLVIIRKAGSEELVTYVEGFVSDHQTFGDYGDVIIYKRYGDERYTPIIHRAMVMIVYNVTSDSYDIPSLAGLPADKWSNDHLENGRWWNLTTFVEIDDVGYKSAKLTLDLNSILRYYHGAGATPKSGIITMGDHNVIFSGGEYEAAYDQISICREPIQPEWIVGEAKFEIPWLGLVKLWISGEMPPTTPENSKTNLLITLGLIIVVPIALDFSLYYLKKKDIHPWQMIRERLKRREKEE